MIYDYAIIGGGVVGSAILNKLTRLGKKCILFEKSDDVANGTSKANTGLIHAGFDAHEGTLKARLNVEGNKLFPKLCKELFVPFKQNGAIVVGTDLEKIKNLYARGTKNGVSNMQILDQPTLKQLLPNLNDKLTVGLLAKSAGIVSPYLFTIALAEESVLNGSKVVLNYEVKRAQFTGTHFRITNNIEEFDAFWIINATGAQYNSIAKLLHSETYPIKYRIGEYYLLDSLVSPITKYSVFPLPTATSKGVVITPTIDGNILIGPNATDISDYSTATSVSGLNEVKEKAKEIFSNIPFNKNIRNFAGVRSIVGEDFIIEKSKRVQNVINIAGICSPGLTSSPAIANYVAFDLLGLKNKEKEMKRRTPIETIRDKTPEQINAMIKKDKNFGKIICRCECVSLAEIIQAIKSPLKPTSVDAIKRRTRAGMGRCQGNFCMAKVMETFDKEKNVSFDNVAKENPQSKIIIGEIKG